VAIVLVLPPRVAKPDNQKGLSFWVQGGRGGSDHLLLNEFFTPETSQRSAFSAQLFYPGVQAQQNEKSQDSQRPFPESQCHILW
jgi:hypothetical protein